MGVIADVVDTIVWARIDAWMREHWESHAACLFIVEDGPLTTDELYELGCAVPVDGDDDIDIFESVGEAGRAAGKLVGKGLVIFDGRWHSTRYAHDYARHYEALARRQ